MATSYAVPPLHEDKDHARRLLADAVLGLSGAQARAADEWLRELRAEPLRRLLDRSPTLTDEDCAIAWEVLWRLAPWSLPRVRNPFGGTLTTPDVPSTRWGDRERLLAAIREQRALFGDSGSLNPDAALDLGRSDDADATSTVLLWGDTDISTSVLSRQAQTLRRTPITERNDGERGDVDPATRRHHRYAVVFCLTRSPTSGDALGYALRMRRHVQRPFLFVAIALVPSWPLRHFLVAHLAPQLVGWE